MPKKKPVVVKEEACPSQQQAGELVCTKGNGGFCDDPKTWQECTNGHRGESGNGKAEEIQPGESVDIHLARLSTGDWYASIGAADSEEAIAQTSPWPWEALRGIAAQLKKRMPELPQYRMAGEQEMGRCIHASADGSLCCILEAPTGAAETIVARLKNTSNFQAVFTDLSNFSEEIVRLYGKLEKPRLVGEEAGDELTATFKMVSDDLTAEYKYLKPSAGKQVVAIIYHAQAAPPESPRPKDQPELFVDPNLKGGDNEMACCPEKVAEKSEEQPATEGEAATETAAEAQPETTEEATPETQEGEAEKVEAPAEPPASE